MNSPTTSLSPRYKNLRNNNRHSPIELKEKMRKSYKEKIQNCRDMIVNRFRSTIDKESDLHNTLNEIYKKMFNFTNMSPVDNEEEEMLEEIRNDLVLEELKWWLKEYDKSQQDLDWSSLEQEDDVICPVCQKTNLIHLNNSISCSYCNMEIKTEKTLNEVKTAILLSVENHVAVCSNEIQFTSVPDLNENHIYMICSSCSEMRIVV